MYFQRLKKLFTYLDMTAPDMDLPVIAPEVFTLNFKPMKRSLI
jgi:hypothetical protein